ncbi:MAG: hypothetical protein AAF433_21265 [Bacteroidota bacterium]
MKKRLLYLALILAFTVPLSAQDEDFPAGQYMQQTFEDLSAKLSLYAESNGYGWRSDLCFAGAIIDLGETIALNVYLKAGTEYSFIGGGDEDISALDLYLVNSEREVVASDTLDDRTPIVDFTPRTSGIYSLRMQLVGCEVGASFVGLALLEKAGAGFSPRDYERAYLHLLENSGNVNSVSSGVYYHADDNQWSTFGFWLTPGETTTVDNLAMGNGNTQWLVSGCETGLTDVNLYLLGEAGNTLKSDVAADNFPLFSNPNLPNTENYGVKVEAVAGNKPGLIFVSILSE